MYRYLQPPILSIVMLLFEDEEGAVPMLYRVGNGLLNLFLEDPYL